MNETAMLEQDKAMTDLGATELKYRRFGDKLVEAVLVVGWHRAAFRCVGRDTTSAFEGVVEIAQRANAKRAPAE